MEEDKESNISLKFDLNQLLVEFKEFSAKEHTLDDSWQLFVDVQNDDIVSKIWRRPESDGSNCWQSWTIINGVSSAEFLEIYKDYDFRRKYETLTTSYYPLVREDKENGDYSHIVYWRSKLPLVGYFTAEREYLFRRSQCKLEDVTIVLDESIQEHEKAPLNPNYVRIPDYNVAMIFKEYEDQKAEVFMKYLTPLNIKMPIPQAVLNWFAGVGLNYFQSMLKKSIAEFKQLQLEKEQC